jgi:hypothetical protein
MWHVNWQRARKKKCSVHQIKTTPKCYSKRDSHSEFWLLISSPKGWNLSVPYPLLTSQNVVMPDRLYRRWKRKIRKKLQPSIRTIFDTFTISYRGAHNCSKKQRRKTTKRWPEVCGHFIFGYLIITNYSQSKISTELQRWILITSFILSLALKQLNMEPISSNEQSYLLRHNASSLLQVNCFGGNHRFHLQGRIIKKTPWSCNQVSYHINISGLMWKNIFIR